MARQLDESGVQDRRANEGTPDEEGAPAEGDVPAEEAPPRAALPITPFGDAKPFAGSLVDPTDPRRPEGQPAADQVDRARAD